MKRGAERRGEERAECNGKGKDTGLAKHPESIKKKIKEAVSTVKLMRDAKLTGGGGVGEIYRLCKVDCTLKCKLE